MTPSDSSLTPSRLLTDSPMSPKMTMLSALLLLMACGCDAASPADNPAAAAADRARAAFALAEAERAVPAPPDDGSPDDGSPDDADDRRPDPNCPRCRGTGTVPSGDGLARVPCSCLRGNLKTQEIKNEVDTTAADAAGGPRVLVFSAGWCRACQTMKPALAAAGAGFETVDVDADPQAAAAFGVTALPTLIRLVDGRETTRTSGARDVSGLRRFRDAGR